MARHVKTCPVCHRQFTASRSDAVYCSGTCRQRHRRGTPSGEFVIRVSDAVPPDPGRPPSAREVTEAVLGVRASLATIAAAAVSGPDEYRALCDRLSHAIADVLEVEGL